MSKITQTTWAAQSEGSRIEAQTLSKDKNVATDQGDLPHFVQKSPDFPQCWNPVVMARRAYNSGRKTCVVFQTWEKESVGLNKSLWHILHSNVVLVESSWAAATDVHWQSHHHIRKKNTNTKWKFIFRLAITCREKCLYLLVIFIRNDIPDEMFLYNLKEYLVSVFSVRVLHIWATLL